MNTINKGEIAELKVQLLAAEKGFIVSRPTVPARYDCIIDDGKSLTRTQIKYADGKSDKAEGSVGIRLQQPFLRRREGKNYRRDEVDLVLAYLPCVDKVVALRPDNFHDKSIVTIRFNPPKNGQKKGIFLVDDFLW